MFKVKVMLWLVLTVMPFRMITKYLFYKMLFVNFFSLIIFRLFGYRSIKKIIQSIVYFCDR